jgi:hypothetical protein
MARETKGLDIIASEPLDENGMKLKIPIVTKDLQNILQETTAITQENEQKLLAENEMLIRMSKNSNERAQEKLIKNDKVSKRTKEEAERITELALKVAINYTDKLANY